MALPLRCSLSLLAMFCLAACTSGGGEASPLVGSGNLSAIAALGEKIFDDPSLSASGRVACASCHERDHAFAGDAVVPTGGVGVDVPGFRNAPSLKYLAQNPAFFFGDADLAANVNTTEPPYDRRPGDLPALSEPEIQDVVAFLQTLTDGFTQ
jgi:mono/diheme cytochrome c family protein